MDREGILTPNFSSVFMSVVFIGSKTRCTSPRKSHVYQKRKAQLSSSNTWCFEVGLETRISNSVAQKAPKISSKRYYNVSMKTQADADDPGPRPLCSCCCFLMAHFKSRHWTEVAPVHTCSITYSNTPYLLTTCTKYVFGDDSASIFVQHECRLLLVLLPWRGRQQQNGDSGGLRGHSWKFLIVVSSLIIFSSPLTSWKSEKKMKNLKMTTLINACP